MSEGWASLMNGAFKESHLGIQRDHFCDRVIVLWAIFVNDVFKIMALRNSNCRDHPWYLPGKRGNFTLWPWDCGPFVSQGLDFWIIEWKSWGGWVGQLKIKLFSLINSHDWNWMELTLLFKYFFPSPLMMIIRGSGSCLVWLAHSWIGGVCSLKHIVWALQFPLREVPSSKFTRSRALQCPVSISEKPVHKQPLAIWN